MKAYIDLFYHYILQKPVIWHSAILFGAGVLTGAFAPHYVAVIAVLLCVAPEVFIKFYKPSK
jgi:hypothetical protein